MDFSTNINQALYHSDIVYTSSIVGTNDLQYVTLNR